MKLSSLKYKREALAALHHFKNRIYMNLLKRTFFSSLRHVQMRRAAKEYDLRRAAYDCDVTSLIKTFFRQAGNTRALPNDTKQYLNAFKMS